MKLNFKNMNEGVKLLFISLVLVIIFITMYGITYLIKNKETKKTTKEYQNEILAGQIWSQKEDKYLVLIENDNNEKLLENIDIISKYAKEHQVGYYYVRLNSIFNKSILGTDSIHAKGENFKIKSSTLLVLKNKEVINSTNNLQELNKYLETIK